MLVEYHLESTRNSGVLDSDVRRPGCPPLATPFNRGKSNSAMIYNFYKIILISLALSCLGVTLGQAGLLADGTLSLAGSKAKVTNGKELVEILRREFSRGPADLQIEATGPQVKGWGGVRDSARLLVALL